MTDNKFKFYNGLFFISLVIVTLIIPFSIYFLIKGNLVVLLLLILIKWLLFFGMFLSYRLMYK